MFERNKRMEEHHAYDPLKDILGTLGNCLQTPTEIRGDKIYCTDWKIDITPEIEDLSDRNAVLNFYLNCPDWDEPLFECCAALGSDAKTAVGGAVGSFIFAFMDGIEAMQDNRDAIPVTSEYAGNEHRWSVYRSNIVGMGDHVEPDFEQYWNALKDGIIKRLGNQRMCYVKVYAAKYMSKDGGTEVTGECRVNDVPSAELGALVAEIAEKFEINNFCSQKMFFFIKQNNSTLLPYPYRMNKIPALREKVKIALEMFNKCGTQEQYNDLLGNMVEALDDGPLAEECFSFLPEICAERAFEQIQFSEQVQFAVNGDTVKIETVYKNQLADFYPLGNLMFQIFDSGYFGEQTNDLYRKLIGISAIGSSVSRLMDEGKELEKCKMTSLIFNVASKFELR